jgi:hypothetical protein
LFFIISPEKVNKKNNPTPENKQPPLLTLKKRTGTSRKKLQITIGKKKKQKKKMSDTEEKPEEKPQHGEAGVRDVDKLKYSDWKEDKAACQVDVLCITKLWGKLGLGTASTDPNAERMRQQALSKLLAFCAGDLQCDKATQTLANMIMNELCHIQGALPRDHHRFMAIIALGQPEFREDFRTASHHWANLWLAQHRNYTVDVRQWTRQMTRIKAHRDLNAICLRLAGAMATKAGQQKSK